jgi:hypothetical protein
MKLAAALCVLLGCGGSKPATPIAAQQTPATLPSPSPSSRHLCPRFEKEPVDMGIEHATALALSVAETCAISDGKVVCVHRAEGARPIVRASDVARVAASPFRRICAQHTDGTFECFGDGHRPYEFGYFEKQDAGWSHGARALALDEDRLEMVGSDGSMRAISFQIGTNAKSEMIWFAVPKPARNEKVREVTIAHEIGGTVTCVLVGTREICRAWHIEETMEMPGPVVTIGGHCALVEDGRVACFAIRSMKLTAPTVLAALSHVRSIASEDGAGGCAVHDDGALTCFGNLGIVEQANGLGPFPSPARIAMPPVEAVAMVDGRTCARTKDGRVFCFGCLALTPLFGDRED